jgi:hypothetical protein
MSGKKVLIGVSIIIVCAILFSIWYFFIRVDPKIAADKKAADKIAADKIAADKKAADKIAADIKIKHEKELLKLQTDVSNSAATASAAVGASKNVQNLVNNAAIKAAETSKVSGEPTSVQLASATAAAEATASAAATGKSLEKQQALAEVASIAAAEKERKRMLTADNVSCKENKPNAKDYWYQGGECVVKTCGDLYKLENGVCNLTGSFKIRNVLSGDYIALCEDGGKWRQVQDTRSCYKRGNTPDQSNVFSILPITGEPDTYEIINNKSGTNMSIFGTSMGDWEMMWDCKKNKSKYDLCKWKITEIPNEPGRYEIMNALGDINIMLSSNGTNHGGVTEWEACNKSSPQYKNGQCKWEFDKQ